MISLTARFRSALPTALAIVACISAVLINVVKLNDAQQTVAFHVQVNISASS